MTYEYSSTILKSFLTAELAVSKLSYGANKMQTYTLPQIERNI